MKPRISYSAAVQAVQAICQGAAEEINSRNLSHGEKFAVRGAALRAIDAIYYDMITHSARDVIRRAIARRAPNTMGSAPSRDHLLEVGGWEKVP
jgi:hypothetical protein